MARHPQRAIWGKDPRGAVRLRPVFRLVEFRLFRISDRRFPRIRAAFVYSNAEPELRPRRSRRWTGAAVARHP